MESIKIIIVVFFEVFGIIFFISNENMRSKISNFLNSNIENTNIKVKTIFLVIILLIIAVWCGFIIKDVVYNLKYVFS